MKYVTINNKIVGATESSDIFDACEKLDLMADYDKADLSLAHQLDTVQIIKYLDDVPDWNSDGVEELMREMCDRLNICFDAYETYDDLYEEIMNGGSKK